MHKFYKKILSKNRGFTLVELLVVLIILSALLLMAIFILNPIAQLNKARDAQRKQDFVQIRNALDTYYNDHNCYPQSGSFSFGSPWIEDNITYMVKVPQDPGPQCINGKCYYYYYQTENTSCPQWAILYAKLGIAPAKGEDCGTKIIRTMCTNNPAFNPKYNYCLPIGQISCTALKDVGAPSGYGQSTPAPTLAPTPAPTLAPTPAPTPIVCNNPSGWSGCPAGLGGNQGCNHIGFPETVCQQFIDGGYPCYCSDDCDGNESCAIR